MEKNQSEPSNNQQKAKQIRAKSPAQQQPSSPTTLPWAVDDFFHFSDLESTDKVEKVSMLDPYVSVCLQRVFIDLSSCLKLSRKDSLISGLGS